MALAAEAVPELAASPALVEAVAAEVAELLADTPAESAFKDAVVALAAEAEALVAALVTLPIVLAVSKSSFSFGAKRE